MKKIPTIFERDWNGDKSRVLDKVNPVCQWVFDGEGIATRKIDGTACMSRAGLLYKRRELRRDEPSPIGFELAAMDEETGKRVGWVPVGDGPEDRWYREAVEAQGVPTDGTYELIGPKVQGNPEGYVNHELVSHNLTGTLPDVPRTFDGLRDWLSTKDIEGIVFHHSDGRMAKIKKRDFGLKRKPKGDPNAD